MTFITYNFELGELEFLLGVKCQLQNHPFLIFSLNASRVWLSLLIMLACGQGSRTRRLRQMLVDFLGWFNRNRLILVVNS